MKALIKAASWMGTRLLVARALFASRGYPTVGSKEVRSPPDWGPREAVTTSKQRSGPAHRGDSTPLELEGSEWAATVKRALNLGPQRNCVRTSVIALPKPRTRDAPTLSADLTDRSATAGA